jgi:hypothetical protein
MDAASQQWIAPWPLTNSHALCAICNLGRSAGRYRRRRGASKSGGKLNDFAPVRRVLDLEKGPHQFKAVNDLRVRLILYAHDLHPVELASRGRTARG